MSDTKELRIYSTPISFKHVVYLNDVVEPDFYEDLFKKLEDCADGDEFNFHINSPGGFEHTAIQLYQAIKNSRAHTTAHVSGMCCSAGTVIMMACDSWNIDKYSKIMVHSSSGISSGKVHEVKSNCDFDSVWIKGFYKEVYSKLLSKKEIDEVLDGKDLWFSGEEVAKKLRGKR